MCQSFANKSSDAFLYPTYGNNCTCALSADDFGNKVDICHLYIGMRGHGHRSTRVFDSARAATWKLQVETKVDESLQACLDRTSV